MKPWGRSRWWSCAATWAEIARAAGTTSQQLFNVGAADRPDLLQAQIELHQSEIDLMEAENDRQRVWQVLAAVVGVPFLGPAGVEGDLEADIPKLDRDSILATFVRDSPEIKRAQAGVERARSTLARAKAEPTPDVLLRGGFGYNFEELDILSGPVGWEGFIEVCDEATVRAQVLYAMVVEVGDIEIAVRRHGHPARRVEGARLGAAGTDDANDLAVWCEHLDAVVEVLGNIEVSVRPEDAVHGPIELSERTPLLAPGGHELAVAPQPLDAVVARIGHVDIAAWADGHADGSVEPTRPRTFFAPCPHQDELKVSAGEEQLPCVPGGDDEQSGRQ